MLGDVLMHSKWKRPAINCAVLLSQAAHGADPDSRMGVDVIRAEAGDMAELGIYESFRVRQQVGYTIAILSNL